MRATWRTVASVRAGALALGALGAGFGLLTLAEAGSAPGGSFRGASSVGGVAELGAGWALIAAGVAESSRRPASRAGLLLAGRGSDGSSRTGTTRAWARRPPSRSG